MKINLNGTSGSVLMDQHIEVMSKAEQLFQALVAAVPHPRDFQTYEDPGAAFREERDAFAERLKQVMSIRKWAEDVCLDLQSQGAST